jgi:hypothetical protein
VATCKDHDDDSYVPPDNPNRGGVYESPAVFPELWQTGTIFSEWTIPKAMQVGYHIANPEVDELDMT